MTDPNAASLTSARRPSRVSDPVLEVVAREKTVPARHTILHQGTVPAVAHVLLAGHTYRYQILSNGQRQITAILYPGDLCDLEAVVRGRADYSVGTLSACTLGEIPIGCVADHARIEPALQQSLWRHLRCDAAIARAWITNIGRRPALERVAHLFCETHARKSRLGLADETGYDSCLTQTELADALGMTMVHVNRVLRELRARGLIERTRGRLTLLDLPALVDLAGFNAGYLQ